NYRFELVVDEINRVDFLARIALDDLVSEIASLSELNFVQHANLLAHDLDGSYTLVFFVFATGHSVWKTPAQHIASLAANGNDVDVLPGFGFEKAGCRLHDVGVEGSSEALVAANHNQQDGLLFTALKQRMAGLTGDGIVDLCARDQRLQHV